MPRNNRQRRGRKARRSRNNRRPKVTKAMVEQMIRDDTMAGHKYNISAVARLPEAKQSPHIFRKFWYYLDAIGVSPVTQFQKVMNLDKMLSHDDVYRLGSACRIKKVEFYSLLMTSLPIITSDTNNPTFHFEAICRVKVFYYHCHELHGCGGCSSAKRFL